jgi:hypothetical protein
MVENHIPTIIINMLVCVSRCSKANDGLSAHLSLQFWRVEQALCGLQVIMRSKKERCVSIVDGYSGRVWWTRNRDARSK